MAKVKWFRIPFVSRKGTHYEVEIYKEGSNPHGEEVLLAGNTPFTTDENDDDDVFTPARTMTGTLSIVFNPSAAYPTVYDFLAAIMPSNNIDTRVVLVNIDNNREIAWQGFINCEIFTQTYTSIAQQIDISVNSILEAADSIPIDEQYFVGRMNVIGIITTVLNLIAKVTNESGLYYVYDALFIPSTSQGGMFASEYYFLDTTVLFEESEFSNGIYTEYVSEGVSCLEVLKRIAKFMGWCIRERGTSIFFFDHNETNHYVRYRRSSAPVQSAMDTEWYSWLNPLISTQQMAQLDFTGSSHKISTQQGVKKVSVTASLKPEGLSLSFPAFPYGGTIFYPYADPSSLVGYPNTIYGYGNGIFTYISNAIAPYSNIHFGYYRGYFEFGLNGSPDVTKGTLYGVSDAATVLANIGMLHSQGAFYGNQYKYMGAFFAKQNIEADWSVNYREGVLLSFLPYIEGQTNPYILEIKTTKQLSFRAGTQLVISYAGNAAGGCYDRITTQLTDEVVFRGDWKYEPIYGDSDVVMMVLKIGNKYYNGSGWTDSYSEFPRALFRISSFSVDIPSNMSGVLTFQILAGTYAYSVQSHLNVIMQDVFLSKLEIQQQIPEEHGLTDRSENKYVRIAGFNFSDEKEIKTEIASNNSNRFSPSIFQDVDGKMVSELKYDDPEDWRYGTYQRPEEHLLDEMYTQFSKNRKMIDLIHEPVAPNPDPYEYLPVPLNRTTGFDGLEYVNIAESMDWKQESCTTRFAEVEPAPSES